MREETPRVIRAGSAYSYSEYYEEQTLHAYFDIDPERYEREKDGSISRNIHLEDIETI